MPVYCRRGKELLEEATLMLNEALLINPEDHGGEYMMAFIRMNLALAYGDRKKTRLIFQEARDKRKRAMEALEKANSCSENEQQQIQHQQQQRQLMMHLHYNQQQQLLAEQQQFRPIQLQMYGQHQMQFYSPMQLGVSQQFNVAQSNPNPLIIPNIPATRPSHSFLPNMQYGLSGANSTHHSQVLSNQCLIREQPTLGIRFQYDSNNLFLTVLLVILCLEIHGGVMTLQIMDLTVDLNMFLEPDHGCTLQAREY